MRLNSTAAICSKGLRVNNSKKARLRRLRAAESPAIKDDTTRRRGRRRETGVETWVEGEKGPLDAREYGDQNEYLRTHSHAHGPNSPRYADSSACGIASGKNLHANSVANPGRAATARRAISFAVSQP